MNFNSIGLFFQSWLVLVLGFCIYLIFDLQLQLWLPARPYHFHLMTGLHSLANLWDMPSVSDTVPGSVTLLCGCLACLVSWLHLVWPLLWDLESEIVSSFGFHGTFLSWCFLYSSNHSFNYPVKSFPSSLLTLYPFLGRSHPLHWLKHWFCVANSQIYKSNFECFSKFYICNANCPLDSFSSLVLIFESTFIIFFF